MLGLVGAGCLSPLCPSAQWSLCCDYFELDRNSFDMVTGPVLSCTNVHINLVIKQVSICHCCLLDLCIIYLDSNLHLLEAGLEDDSCQHREGVETGVSTSLSSGKNTCQSYSVSSLSAFSMSCL